MTAADDRRWHRAFIVALGHRRATLMSDRDDDDMREMRAEGMTPEEAAESILATLRLRHGAIVDRRDGRL